MWDWESTDRWLNSWHTASQDDLGPRRGNKVALGWGGVLLMSSLPFFPPAETVLSCSSEFAPITGAYWEEGTTGWDWRSLGKHTCVYRCAWILSR